MLFCSFKTTFQKWLIDNRILDENEKKEYMEKKFLPVAGERQKELEEYLDNIDVSCLTKFTFQHN